MRPDSSAAQGRCKHGYPVRDDDPTVQECIENESPAAQGHEIAFGILCAAMGEPRAWALWNRWTADQRDEVATFAGDHFGAQLRSLADELIAWKERHAKS